MFDEQLTRYIVENKYTYAAKILPTFHFNRTQIKLYDYFILKSKDQTNCKLYFDTELNMKIPTSQGQLKKNV